MCGNFTVEPLCSLRHTDEPQKGQNSCLRLRPRSVLVLSVLCWCLTKLIFTLSKISFAEFSVSTQCIFLLVRSFIDPTFCGIFVCGPLQYKCQFTCGRTLPSLPFSPRGRVQLHVGPLGCIHTLFGAYEEYEIYFFGRGYLIKIADNRGLSSTMLKRPDTSTSKRGLLIICSLFKNWSSTEVLLWLVGCTLPKPPVVISQTGTSFP